MKVFNYILFYIFLSSLLLSCTKKQPDYWKDKDDDGGGEIEQRSDKPRYIWIDAAANFPDFANSKENIARDLKLAKEAGFTDIVVDVRPSTGDVLYRTTYVDEVKYLYAWSGGQYSKIDRSATWDYLQAFIDEGKTLGLRVHAGFNTFVGGNTMNGGTGMLYREKDRFHWASYLNLGSGITNIMATGESTKFLNPCSDEVQTYLCNLLKDLAKYDLSGIVLDRGRFMDLTADFSDITKSKFESYLGGVKLDNFPDEIIAKGAKALPSPKTAYIDKWLEFRVKTIYDFMQKARDAVKGINPKIKFGVYVGGWYSSYYDVGVNWASSNYKTSRYFPWASDNYNKYGFAGLMDHMLIGAYATPLNVYGSTEWTMAGFCNLAKEKIGTACPLVVGGPDVGNWDPNSVATQDQENMAVRNSVKACMDSCDGYFLFDMIHLKMANQWQYVKEGIDIAVGK